MHDDANQTEHERTTRHTDTALKAAARHSAPRAPAIIPPAPAVIPPAPARPLDPGQPPPLLRVPKRRRSLLVPALLLLVALAGAGWGWRTWLQAVPVEVVHPWRGAALEAVYATGVVEAIDTARIGTMVAGRIDQLAVEEGDTVRAGDLMAQLDDRQPRQRVADARARLVTAEDDLVRTRDLITRGVRSQQQLERAVQERDQAAALLMLAVRQLDEYRILAPLDAVVMKRPVEPGETVAANATLYQVASTARLRVAADVDELFTAAVTNIRRQGETATRTFRVEALLPPDTKLLIGMTVDVNVVVAERAAALLVPAAAVRHDPPSGGRPGPAWVTRVVDDRAARTAVAIGAAGAQSVEIRAGLTEADVVVAGPAARLSAGQRVRAHEAAPGGGAVR
jgi:multidrug efflux pump subunit AcrA (membrane-fusion protein)